MKENKKNWKRLFTYLLVLSKFTVFSMFMYVATIMYVIGRPLESIIIIFAVAFYLVLNKLGEF